MSQPLPSSEYRSLVDSIGNLLQKAKKQIATTITGMEADVDALHDRLASDGYTIASPLRHTGDGYYEFAVLDPEGNYVEISAE